MSEITVVTAFFDIGRGQWSCRNNGAPVPPYLRRSTREYLENFVRLAKLDNDMVIHTTADMAQTVAAIRERAGRGSRTKVVVHPPLTETHADLIHRIQAVMDDATFIANVRRPDMPEYWNPLYVLVNLLKSTFVRQSETSSDTVAWIDFGYCRDDASLPANLSWRHDFGDKINLFHIRPLDDRPIREVVFSGDVYVQGCSILAPRTGWDRLEVLVQSALDELLDAGMIDDDQTLLLMAQRAAPAEFEMRCVDTSRRGWFTIFTDYP